ncbi:MAG: hypothetical protein EA383_05945 [Spirochaetaceae bacterium]|nr:MAG: hypothetical protein EA383_05945 [Spirochaetaceae bacterium]
MLRACIMSSNVTRGSTHDKVLPLLAVDTFLVGLAFGLLYNVGYTLLVYRFGSGGLRLAYLLAGVIVPLVSLLFQAVEERVAVSRLSTATRLIFAITAPALFLLVVLDTDSPFTPFLVMLSYTMGALYTFMLRGSIAAEVYDPRALKGVYPRLTAWEMGAVITAGLLVTPLVRILGSVEALLPLSGLVLLASLLVGRQVQARIASGGEHEGQHTGHAAPGSDSPHSEHPHHHSTGSIRTMLRNRYAMLVFLYQFLAFTTSLMVQYVVYTQAQRVFLGQEDLTQFIGLAKSLVTAAAMLFTFVAAGALLLRYGMLAGLGAGPVLIATGIIVALIAAAFGIPPQGFLVVLVAVQALEYGSYSGFAKTSLQSAFQPLPVHEREAVHGFAQGIGIPLSYGFSGLLLIGLSSIGGGGSDYAIAVTLILVAAYGAVGVLLFRAYGTQLRTSLARRRIEGVDLVFADASTREVLNRLLDTSDRWQVHAALDLMQEAHMPEYETSVHQLLDSPSPEVRSEAFTRAEELRPAWLEARAREAIAGTEPALVRSAAVGALCASLDDPVLEVSSLLDDPEPEVRAAAVTGLFLYGGINGILKAGDVFNALLESDDPEERCHAADILQRLSVRSFFQPLLKLLQDDDETVRLHALRAAGEVGHPHLLPEVIRLTKPPATRSEALSALAEFNDELLPVLGDVIAGRSSWNAETGVRIVRAAARIHDASVTEVLVSGISLPPGDLSVAVLQSLVSRNYRARGGTIPRVLDAIEHRMQRAAVAVMTINDLGQPREPEPAALLSAVQDRYRHDVEESFLLLSLLHAPDEVQGAKTKMLEGATRDRALAAEMLDVTLSGPLRQKMLAVTEHRDGESPPVTSYAELFGLHPRGETERIRQIVNDREIWPEEWPAQCAAAAAWRRGIVSEKPEDTVLTTIERVLALKTADMFAGIPDAVLAHIASIMEEIDVPAQDEFIHKGEIGRCMYIIREGLVAVHDADRTFAKLGPGEVVGEMAVLDPQPRSASATAVEDTVLLRLDKDPFDSVMADHPALAQGVIAVLCRRLRG